MTDNKHSEAIQRLEQAIRDIRVGNIDGFILITTHGPLVKSCIRAGISYGALGNLSLQLQKVNQECVEAWSQLEQFNAAPQPTMTIVKDVDRQEQDKPDDDRR